MVGCSAGSGGEDGSATGGEGVGEDDDCGNNCGSMGEVDGN